MQLYSSHSTIMHLDLNAFFASCEQAANPELKGKPVVVGGDSRRSVVSAASYEARKRGIHAGMPYFKAYELCPEAVYLPVNFALYTEISRKVFAILNNFSYCIEKAGIDEGFIDISGGIQLFGSPADIAHQMIAQIREELDIDATIGIARTKSVAKLASGLAKPTNKKGGLTGFISDDGVLEIPPSETEQFLLGLPINALYGVGRKTNEKLHKIGINTVAEYLETPQNVILHNIGTAATNTINKLATGTDYDEVIYVPPDPKSIGREITLRENTHDYDVLNNVLIALANDIAGTLRSQNFYCNNITLVIKTFDHMRHSRSHTLSTSTNSAHEIQSIASKMLKQWLSDDSREIRLIGISTAKFAETSNGRAQSLFDAIDPKNAKIDRINTAERTIDNIKRKFANKDEKIDVTVGAITHDQSFGRKM